MTKKRWTGAALAVLMAQGVLAGGINTNTNMSVAFDRMLSRDAVIAADGVYFNPAGVVFMAPGFHYSMGWQLITQCRYIDNSYAPYANNTADPTTSREFKGKALAPFFPTFQMAYNCGKYSFQANAGVSGGGGKCTFDDGLGSFEKIVSETAMAASGLAATIDNALGQQLLGAGVPAALVQQLGAKGFSSGNYFGAKGSYSATSFMRGRQYYYGLSIGVAYKLTDNLGVAAGARGVYASSNYYGYVRNIKVGNVPLYTVLDPSKENSADIELNCDQSGFGVTPIIGIDYRLGKWNFAAKYEFKTRMRLRNSAVNQFPSIGNLGSNLATALATNLQKAGLSAETARSVTIATLTSSQVSVTTSMLKQKFDESINTATDEYQDGKKIAGDLPAILSVGVAYTPIDQVRLDAGLHYYYDKQATQYNGRQKKLKRGTIEYSCAMEYDPVKWLTVSAGYQRTSYGLTKDYMDDKTFVVSSDGVGCGFAIRTSVRSRVNVSYFHSFYETVNTSKDVDLNGTKVPYTADFTRHNNVFGVGLDLDL